MGAVPRAVPTLTAQGDNPIGRVQDGTSTLLPHSHPAAQAVSLFPTNTTQANGIQDHAEHSEPGTQGPPTAAVSSLRQEESTGWLDALEGI